MNSIQGAGLGFRAQHYRQLLNTQAPINWLEALADNHMRKDSLSQMQLLQLCEQYPVVLHCVGMSLGSTDPLNIEYFKRLKYLCDRVKPTWISDHCCWISFNQHYLHDLLPLPYTDETITHISNRIKQVQEMLERPFLLENLSSYFTYKQSTMPEWTFINHILNEADCYMLLDVNNVYVSAYNHNFDALDYFTGIDKSRIKQIHLAGFDNRGTHYYDTHGSAICDQVWQLYEQAIQHFGSIPTLIERDNNIPTLETLIDEAKQAQSILDRNTKEIHYAQ